jgi:hypothetical protein
MVTLVQERAIGFSKILGELIGVRMATLEF